MNGSTGRNQHAHGPLARAISEQIQRALEVVDSREDVAQAVHEARRAIKRARALLRLAAPPPRTSQTAFALRDAGRALAGLRDASVVVATAEGLHGESGPNEVPMVPQTLLESLEEERARRFKESGSAKGPLQVAGGLLRAMVAEAQQFQAQDDTAGQTPEASGGVELLWSGVRAAYTAVRLRSDPADGQGTTQRPGSGEEHRPVDRQEAVDERSHKLRKRVKDLRYQLEFLNTGHPKLDRLVRDLHHLTDLLGDRNDLAVFGEIAAATDVLSEGKRSALSAHIESRKQTLGSEAKALSDRLFEEATDPFVSRVREWVTLPQG